MFLVGNPDLLPSYDGKLYLAAVDQYSEFNPTAHKQLILEVVAKERPDVVVFSHSSYGWDLAPRVALALKAAQISEVVAVTDGAYIVPACNSKLRRKLRPKSAVTVVTLQAGAFNPAAQGGRRMSNCSPALPPGRLSFSATQRPSGPVSI